jgi:two-component system sensor histidine kinase UhpB
MSELRPPLLDDHGLLPALEWFGRQFAERTGIRVQVLGDAAERRAAPAAEIALFRIAQEALTNVAKHARAAGVDIVVHQSTAELKLSVVDDGAGFDAACPPAQGGLGMATMRERTQAVGGSFDVVTAPGRGTRIEVRIPC